MERPRCIWAAAAPLFLLAASSAAADFSMDPSGPWALLGWDDAAGRLVRDEGDSEGPKSFVPKAGGGAFVLDQVNLRVLELNEAGEVTGSVELPGATFDDLLVFEDRALLALDRLGTRSLVVMDMRGTRLLDLPLEGHGISHSGLITAMFSLADGVWVEVEHRYSVRILDRDLRPCQRRVVLGRPTSRGRSLQAALDGEGGVILSTSPLNQPPNLGPVTLTASSPIRRIVWLDQADDGRIFIVLHEASFADESPFQVTGERYLMVTLDEELRELSRNTSPFVLTSLDQRVEFRLGPADDLFQMAFTDQGVALLRFEPRSP